MALMHVIESVTMDIDWAMTRGMSGEPTAIDAERDEATHAVFDEAASIAAQHERDITTVARVGSPRLGQYHLECDGIRGSPG